MGIKIKITYIDSIGAIKALKANIYTWMDLSNLLINNSIQDSSVLRIERDLNASAEDTFEI